MSSDESDRVAALELTVAELSAQLNELSKQLASVRGELGRVGGDGRPTMRGDHTCPACAHRRILFAADVLDRASEGREAMALVQPSMWRSRTVGKFQVYICARCGQVEWYIEDPAELEAEKDVCQLFEPAPREPEGPYR